jgi:hypothetical protein
MLPSFDTTIANPARMWTYWVGGKDHFTADREAAAAVMLAMPSLPETRPVHRAVPHRRRA